MSDVQSRWSRWGRWSALKRWAVYAVAVAMTGVAGAVFAIGFRLALHHGFERLYGSADALVAFASLPLAWRVIAPAAGGFLAGVVTARRGGGQNVGAILEAVTLGRGRLSLRATLWKSLASFAALVGGGSLGREGSIVQFGAASGGALGERLGLDARRVRVLVAAGTAAGFASAYNTPIAAVLFVVEVVVGVATVELILPVAAAAALATAITRRAVGGGPIYGARAFAIGSNAEYGAYLLLGVAGALVGAGFLTFLTEGEKRFDAARLSRPVKGALGGALVGLVACALPTVTGNGYEAIQRVLDGRVAVPLIAMMLLAKTLATTASVSSGSPGGVFTPSLFLGAALGGLVGAGVRSLPWVFGHGVTVGGYALVGMAAVSAATTHAPLMAAVLVFELSGDYAVVLPLMLATTMAAALSRRLRPRSVYTQELERRGIAWEGDLAERLAKAVRARDIMEMGAPVVSAGAPLSEALALFAKGSGRRVYVENNGGGVRAVDLHAAREAWEAQARGDRVLQTAGDAATEVPVATLDDGLGELNEKLWKTDWGEIAVVDRAEPGRVVGTVTRRALLGAFDRELLQRDVLLTRVVWRDGDAPAADYLELPAGQRAEVVPVSGEALGEGIDVGNIRKKYRVTVVAIRKSGDGVWRDPEEVREVTDGDRAMVVGEPGAIERFAKKTL